MLVLLEEVRLLTPPIAKPPTTPARAPSNAKTIMFSRSAFFRLMEASWVFQSDETWPVMGLLGAVGVEHPGCAEVAGCPFFVTPSIKTIYRVNSSRYFAVANR